MATFLRFKVGKEPLPNFRMIEHHFMLGKLVKSFDFSTGFCIPNTENDMETIYEMPELTDDERELPVGLRVGFGQAPVCCDA